MVGEEGVGGQRAVRPAPASHSHPPQWMRGLGPGEGRGRAVTFCSLSTQVLHRRRPGRTGVAWAAAAFKYRPGAPRAHRIFGRPGRQPIGVEVVLPGRGGGVPAGTGAQ